MKVKTAYVIFETDSPVIEGAEKLRGYIGNKFPEHLVLHHHLEGTQYLYTYPLVQYKVIEGIPSILGIEEGADVLNDISGEMEELSLGKSHYHLEQITTHQKIYEIKPRKQAQYKFITPWIGLNSENYQMYNKMHDWSEKKLFLNKKIVGNILSMCKGLGIIVNRKLYVHSRLDPQIISFKGLKLMGFTGEFRVNFQIPDFFGLGKGVSQGSGTLKEIYDVKSGDL